MATGGPPLPRAKHPVTSSPDCPRCGSLCLGPVILPCGHVTCRRCLHDALQQLGQRASCPQCGHHLDLPRDRAVTVRELVQRLGTEPILDQLVKQELDKAADPRCLNCENKQAVSVCLDCQEFYCDFCAAVHRKGRIGKDHVLHALSQPLQNSPRTPRATPGPGSRPLSSSSKQSVSSLDSIRNVLDPRSRDQSRGVEWKEWAAKETGLLQEAFREKLAVKAVLQNVLSLGQELLDKVNVEEHILDAYLYRLPRLDVSRGTTESGTFVIHAPGSDVSIGVRRESMERRLGVVRQCGRRPDVNAVKMVETQLDQLLHCADHEDNLNFPSSTPAQSSTSSSSALTPAATPLPPATHSATHTFAPTVDVMTATPQRLFTSVPSTGDDSGKPKISSIVSLPEDALVMADYFNSKVKVMGVTSPHTVSASLRVTEIPWHLALLSDGLVALTTWEPVIYLIEVTDSVTITSRVQTASYYDGIAGQRDGHLLVSCSEGNGSPAAVHLLTRQGDVVRAVTDSARLTILKSPSCIYDDGENHILVADYLKHLVHGIEVSSGHVTRIYDHPDIRFPTHVCADRAGVVYVARGGSAAGEDGGWVMARGREGQWRRLLSPDLSDPGFVYPVSLCLTRAGRLVVVWQDRYCDTVVIGYELA